MTNLTKVLNILHLLKQPPKTNPSFLLLLQLLFLLLLLLLLLLPQQVSLFTLYLWVNQSVASNRLIWKQHPQILHIANDVQNSPSRQFSQRIRQNNKQSETVTFLFFSSSSSAAACKDSLSPTTAWIQSACLLACLLSSCFFLCESREECLAMVRRETGRKEREERRGGRVCCSGRNSNLESIRSGGTPTVTFAFWKIFTYCYGVLLLYPPTLIRLIWTF